MQKKLTKQTHVSRKSKDEAQELSGGWNFVIGMKPVMKQGLHPCQYGSQDMESMRVGSLYRVDPELLVWQRESKDWVQRKPFRWIEKLNIKVVIQKEML